MIMKPRLTPLPREANGCLTRSQRTRLVFRGVCPHPFQKRCIGGLLRSIRRSITSPAEIFCKDVEPASVSSITNRQNTPAAVYRLNGTQTGGCKLRRGLNIIRDSDGQMRKIMAK